MKKTSRGADPRGERQWLTVGQTAQLLGVSTQTVRKWSAAGRLPELRTEGGHRRYDRAVVEGLVAGRTSSFPATPDVTDSSTHASAALSDIIQALAEERDPRFVLDLACERLMEAMSATSAAISFYDAEVGRIVELADQGEGAELDLPSFPVDDYPVTARVIREQTCIVVNLGDPEADPAECAVLREFGNTSVLIAPLVVGGATIGLAEISDNRGPRQYSGAQLETLERLCSQIALAVHITQLIERLKTQHELTQQRNAEFELLLHTSQAIGSSVDLQETLSAITKSITETFDVAWSDFYEWLPEEGVLMVTACHQIDAIPYWENWLGTRLSGDSIRGWETTLTDHTPSLAYVDDSDISPVEREEMQEYGEKASLGVAVVYAGEMIGLLDVGESRSERRFTEDEVRLLQAIADQAAPALHNAREYDMSQRRAAELATLLGVSESLTSSTDVEAMLGVLCAQLRGTLDVFLAEAYVVDEETGRLVCSAADSLEPLDIKDWNGSLDPDEAPTMAAAISEQTTRVAQIDDPELPEATRAAMERWHEQSALVVPMIHRDQVLGAIYLAETRTKRTFGERDIRLATAIASQGSVAVENARVYALLTRQAITDGLTGLHNHRYLDEYLESEVAKARRYDSNLSVLMLDIDNFKRFNDTFGHPQGDMLLKEIATILLDCTRNKIDLAARYGGEEFCLVLPNTPPKDDEVPDDETIAEAVARSGALVAERVRSAIAERLFEGGPGRRDEHVTVSIGVAAMSSSGDDPAAVIADADKALYLAKNSGKNKVVIFGD